MQDAGETGDVGVAGDSGEWLIWESLWISLERRHRSSRRCDGNHTGTRSQEVHELHG